MMRPFNLLLLSCVSVGCAVGNHHRYDDVVAQIPYSGNEHLVVMCVDLRPYVLDHDKTADFVGLSRGGYGNPFDVRTDSRRSLSDDVAHALAESLNAKGFDAIALQTQVGDQQQNAVEAIVASGRPKGIVVVLREWKSDKELLSNPEVAGALGANSSSPQ